MPSSVIYKINYDPDISTLRIIFVSGKVYEYSDVPQDVYQSFKKALSKGIYFNRFVKGKYPFKRI